MRIPQRNKNDSWHCAQKKNIRKKLKTTKKKIKNTEIETEAENAAQTFENLFNFWIVSSELNKTK